MLGAVGVLQFEVIDHRLKSEYGVNAGFDRLPYVPCPLGGRRGRSTSEKFERPGLTTSVRRTSKDAPVVLVRQRMGHPDSGPRITPS